MCWLKLKIRKLNYILFLLIVKFFENAKQELLYKSNNYNFRVMPERL